MCKSGVEERLLRVVQARSCVKVNGTLSEEFVVKVGVHQGLVLSPFLFIMVLAASSRKFTAGCPEELLEADDLEVGHALYIINGLVATLYSVFSVNIGCNLRCSSMKGRG